MSALKKQQDREDENLASEEAEFLAIAHELHYEIRKLREEMLKLTEKSERDDLTGLLRRDAFLKKTDEVFMDDVIPMDGKALIVIDVDHFKTINDEHGHPVGDEVLKRISRILKEYESPTIHVARIGGEEFALSLKANEAEALSLANEIRRKVEREAAPHLPKFTVSAGVAASCRRKKVRFEDLYQRSDEALYYSKQNGRNRVTLAE